MANSISYINTRQFLSVLNYVLAKQYNVFVKTKKITNGDLRFKGVSQVQFDKVVEILNEKQIPILSKTNVLCVKGDTTLENLTYENRNFISRADESFKGVAYINYTSEPFNKVMIVRNILGGQNITFNHIKDTIISSPEILSIFGLSMDKQLNEKNNIPLDLDKLNRAKVIVDYSATKKMKSIAEEIIALRLANRKIKRFDSWYNSNSKKISKMKLPPIPDSEYQQMAERSSSFANAVFSSAKLKVLYLICKQANIDLVDHFIEARKYRGTSIQDLVDNIVADNDFSIKARINEIRKCHKFNSYFEGEGAYKRSRNIKRISNVDIDKVVNSLGKISSIYDGIAGKSF